MGISVIQAPSEGEAQASYMARNNQVYAVASQDYDCLLFGSPRIIQNLTLAKKRKTVSGYIEIKPEMIELDRVLNHLQIDHDQMICLGIITGTDYNPGGIFKMGQKKALQAVQKFKQPAIIFKQFPEINFDWKKIEVGFLFSAQGQFSFQNKSRESLARCRPTRGMPLHFPRALYYLFRRSTCFLPEFLLPMSPTARG